MDRHDEYESRARRLGVPFIDLAHYRLSCNPTTYLSKAVASSHQILPIRQDNEVLFVAVAEIGSMERLSPLFAGSPYRLRQVLAVPEDLQAAIERVYDERSED